jgi:hypothetical protein
MQRKPSSTLPQAGARSLIVCGIAGRLREKSFTRALLRDAQELAPEGMEIRIFDRMGESRRSTRT